ncbi:hypothetical protein BFJ67_g17258 [Fusarium oxysporum f. sp. cepae]|nr:hypothetical protein BFJ67_g17258 [Fusarium oxysporum f. sp. cepae]
MSHELQSDVIGDNLLEMASTSFPLDLRNLSLPLLFTLQSRTASGFLFTNTSHGTLRSDLLRLISAATSDNFDFDHVKPLLKSALAIEPDALVGLLPSNRPHGCAIQAAFANLSEHRKYVDYALKPELGSIYTELRRFYDAYFGGVAGLDAASQAFFDQCVERSDPVFADCWKGRPEDANQDDVLSWLGDFSDKLTGFVDSHGSISTHQYGRRPLAQPNKSIQGSTGERKLDVVFVKDSKAGETRSATGRRSWCLER